MAETDQFWIKFGEKAASLDHVPGEQLPSTEYLWRRLQQRFQKDKRRRRMYRYGIAASFTILFSVLLSLSTYRNSSVPEAGSTPANVVQATPITITLPAENTVAKNAIPKTAIPKTTMVQQTKKTNYPAIRETELVPVIPPAPEMVIQTPAPEMIAPIAPPIATTLPRERTQMQVVHVRDLGPSAFFTIKPGVDQYEVRKLLKQKSTAKTAIASSSQQEDHIITKN